MISPQVFFQTFLQQLGDESEAYRVWNIDSWSGLKSWTKAMTAALVRTTREIIDKNICTAAIGFPDKYGCSEYLTLDVCAYDGKGWIPSDVGWSPPLIIIEHENRPEKREIQYRAWKLMCVEAQLRVLVAYANPKASSPQLISSRDSLRSAVEEVRGYHHQKPILVIAGEWYVQDWRNVFESYPLGYGINYPLQ